MQKRNDESREKSQGEPAGSPAWVRVAEKCAFSIRDTSEPAVFRDSMWLSNAYGEGGVLVRDLWRSTDGIEWIRVSDNTPTTATARWRSTAARSGR